MIMDSKTWIDDTGLHIEDESLKYAMERVTASASLVGGMVGDSCPAKTIFDSKLKNEVIPIPPDSPLTRGTAFHRIMELYYGLPIDVRGNGINGRILNAAAKKALRELPDDVAHDHDFLTWLRQSVDNYMGMDADYTNVIIPEFPDKHGDMAPGLELPVSGTIGSASRRTFGKIDRMTMNGDGHVIIDDYKTGAKAHVYDPKDRYADFSYIRQQIMYDMLMEDDDRVRSMGLTIDSARLIYPFPNKVITVDIHNEKYRQRTIKDVETASKMLDDAAETNTYACSPSKLCSWCPLSAICPRADRDPRPKFVKARASQPTAEVLAPVVSGRN